MCGGRVEKIHSPAPGLLALTLYNFGCRKIISLRCEKPCNQSSRAEFLKQTKAPPCIYWTSTRLPNPERPSVQVMTLRKYLLGRRLGTARSDWLRRRIFFYLPETKNSSLSYRWLCLDLQRGAYLCSEIPDIPSPLWPDPGLLFHEYGKIPDEPFLWRAFSVLTPSLRRTLYALDPPEAAALLADLADESEKNQGNLYLYKLEEVPHLLSAWPLPEKLKQNLEESVLASYPEEEASGCCLLEAARAVWEPGVIASLDMGERKKQAALAKSLETRLKKTLLKLDQEEVRLKAMLALRQKALLLQSCLWQYDSGQKTDGLNIRSPEHTGSTFIPLDPSKTLLENMLDLFKQSAKGERGLRFVEKRRLSLRLELERIHGSLSGPPAILQPSPKTAPCRDLPIQVQRFISSDGFTLLRGRSAKGNLLLLKQARPYDLWLHVQGGPSAHVVIRLPCPGADIPERTLQEAGILSALKSWKKYDNRAEIISALVKNVKPAKSSPSGTVLVNKQQGSFTVRPDSVPELENKLRAWKPD